MLVLLSVFKLQPSEYIQWLRCAWAPLSEKEGHLPRGWEARKTMPSLQERRLMLCQETGLPHLWTGSSNCSPPPARLWEGKLLLAAVPPPDPWLQAPLCSAPLPQAQLQLPTLFTPTAAAARTRNHAGTQLLNQSSPESAGDLKFWRGCGAKL